MQEHTGEDLLHLFAVGDIDGGLLVGVKNPRIGSFVEKSTHDVLFAVLMLERRVNDDSMAQDLGPMLYNESFLLGQ